MYDELKKRLKDAIDFAQVQRVLVVKLRHHGDVLLTSPVFVTLKMHYPHLALDALIYQDTLEMLSLHPDIRQIYTVDKRWKKLGAIAHLKAETGLIRTLRNNHYDLIIHLTENNRGQWLTRLLKPRFSIAPSFAARKGRLWRASFTHTYATPASPRHTVERHLDALRRVGVYPAGRAKTVKLVAGAPADQQIHALLERFDLQPKQFIHLHPTSRWLFKCWPPRCFAQLIDLLSAQGLRVVLTSAPDREELDFIQAILSHTETEIVNLAGELSLKELAALTAQAKAFVGVDSAPMHIAAAMQTPTIALFGPSGDLEWGPWQVAGEVITSNHSCRPCGMDGCGNGKISDCLATIPATTVHESLQPLL